MIGQSYTKIILDATPITSYKDGIDKMQTETVVMDILMVVTAGGLVWLIAYILYTLLQALLYGSLTLSTGIGGFYMYETLSGPDLFHIFDVGVNLGEFVTLMLLVATMKFGSRFFQEVSIAGPKLINPLSSK